MIGGTRADIRESRSALGRGDTSVAEQVELTLKAIGDVDGELGAFVSVAEDGALREAEAADRRIRAMGPAAWADRPLLGVTVSVKDLIQTRDLPTRRGSLLKNSRLPHDAPSVERLRGAGAIVIGKTATSEYGWCASTGTRFAAPTRNPWSRQHSAGGSSGGAAAAVSAGLCTAALGTDGAGSIRIPAAFCGVVGYKPSYGHIPYVPACADRLAHVGPLARSVRDIIDLVEVLAGPHHEDPDSWIGGPDRGGADGRGDKPESLRIGWLEFPGTSAEVRRISEQAWPALVAQGCVDPVEVPFPDPYHALVDLICAADAAGTLPEDEEWCDAGRVEIIRHGRTVDGAAVLRAEEARLGLRTTLRSVMERFDLLAMATVPTEPFEAGAIGPGWAADPKDLLWIAWSPATYPFNLTGQPAMSLPVGLTSAGLPVGLQLVGRFGGDGSLLSAAGRIEADLAPLPARSQQLTKGG